MTIGDGPDRGVVAGRRELEGGSLSSREWVAGLIDRIGRVDRPESVNAILDVLDDALTIADERDRERRRGSTRGPLHGVPVVVKDNIEVRGGRATAGSLALDAGRCAADATLVKRLRDAGAIVMATANLSEWANIRSGASSSGWSAVGGLVGNPWRTSCSAGGSSSGSGAALAARFTPLAIGTETDGSITCPASLNGVVGLKPTVGRVPTDGVVPISSSQDAPGPMARRVDDLVDAFAVLSEVHDFARRVDSVDTANLRVGVVDAWFTGHEATDGLVREAIRALGDSVTGLVEVPFEATPESVQSDELTVLLAELHDELDRYLAKRPNTAVRSLADVVEFNRLRADVELAHFGQEFFELALTTSTRTPEYREARRRNLEWAQSGFDSAWNRADVLVAPAYGPAWVTDFAAGHAKAIGGSSTTPAAIVGTPIVTVPCGVVDGLPIGVAFIGPANSEAVLVSLARRAEEVFAIVDDPSFRPRIASA